MQTGRANCFMQKIKAMPAGKKTGQIAAAGGPCQQLAAHRDPPPSREKPFMSRALVNTTALVTGASRGIGRAIALKLAEAGALVCVHYGHRRDAAQAVVQEIEETGGRAFALGADLRNLPDIEELFVHLDRELALRNAAGLDILVNNAGVGLVGSLEATDPSSFDEVFAVNVRAPFFVLQNALPRFQDGGRVINLSSMVSHNAYPGFIAYAASKAAIDSMTRSLAAELGRRNITVNAVAPGATQTDFLGDLAEDDVLMESLAAQAALGRLGQAQDIADVVAFLASPAGGWITGERIRASGGMHL